MISFPNGKINIGLQVTEKRNDGFHNLVSCFYPIPWTDVLEIIPSDTLSFESSGIEIPGEGNLCMQAYELIRKDHHISPVSIHLYKAIPIGAGLGGGSSDAAFTIKMLNEFFSLELTNDEMVAYAKQLGSDCSFFIENKPQLCLEKGDVFEEIKIDLTGKHIILIYPDLHISTQEAYAGISPKEPSVNIKEVIEQSSIENWGSIHNDFESSLFPSHPVLAQIKQQLYDKGALYASMSGSGSTVYGIFDKEVEMKSPHKIFSAAL